MELNDRIDLFLKRINDIGVFYLPHELRELFSQDFLESGDWLIFYSTLEEENLIISQHKMGSDNYSISPKGRRIVEKGGWIAHLKNQERDEELIKKMSKIEFELAESNIKSNKENTKIARQNLWFTILNFFFGSINLIALIKEFIIPMLKR